MGKLGKALMGTMMCGGKYQKFDDHVDLDLDLESQQQRPMRPKKRSKILSYSCEECGHRGLVKVRDSQRQDDSMGLNNMEENQSKINFRRSTSDLLLATKNIRCVHNDLQNVKSSSPIVTLDKASVIKKLHMLGFCKSSTDMLTPFITADHEVPETSVILQSDAELSALSQAPWYQPGLSRDIANEVLSPQKVGSFLVRHSESRPDSYALSIKVPNQSIVHYLIVSSTQGWSIKGSLKIFSSLTSLIVHHSVMSELLPCPLVLGGPSINVNCSTKPSSDEDNHESDKNSDFADLDLADYPDLLFTLRKAFGSSTELSSLPASSPITMSDISSTTSSI